MRLLVLLVLLFGCDMRDVSTPHDGGAQKHRVSAHSVFVPVVPVHVSSDQHVTPQPTRVMPARPIAAPTPHVTPMAAHPSVHTVVTHPPVHVAPSVHVH